MLTNGGDRQKRRFEVGSEGRESCSRVGRGSLKLRRCLPALAADSIEKQNHVRKVRKSRIRSNLMGRTKFYRMFLKQAAANVTEHWFHTTHHLIC